MPRSPAGKICIVIGEANPAQLEEAILKATPEANYLELRLDCLKASDLTASNFKKWVRLTEVPVIATLRRKANGGQFTGSEAEQVEILKAALEANVAFLDVEIETIENYLHGEVALLKKAPTRLIVSYHNFEETPLSLESIYERLLQIRPDVLKVATLAHSFSDNFRLLELIEKTRQQNLSIISVAMGELGVYSRIVAPSRGALLTYGSMGNSQATAPGQLSAHDLRLVYALDEINEQTRFYGVIGYPVGHSLSPQIHNAAFRERGLNARYLPLAIQDLQDFGPHLKRFAGFSITIPHKVAILSYVDRLDSTVKMTGAANTLVRQGDDLWAYNTDVYGIRYALRKPLEEGIHQTTLLGAGGAARSAAIVLKESHCQVTVLGRDPEKTRRFASEFGFAYDSLSQAPKYRGELLINATPLGMSPGTEQTPLQDHAIHYRWVFDMVYNPLETRLMRQSKGKALVISGLEMFVAQAAKQFELWTGLEPPRDSMRKIALEKLNASNRSAS